MKWWTILFFGSLALNSMLAVFQKPFEIKDSGEYEWLSFNLRNSGLHYSGDPEAELDYRLYNKRPPLYSVFIGINQSPQSILLILLQTLLLCCLYFIGLSCLRAFCFPSELAKIYTFLMALNTPLLFSVGFTLADLFLALEISVLVYSILTFFRTGRHSYLYLASAFLSLSILTKPVMLPLGIFITPVLLWLFFTRKYKWMVLTPIITLFSLVAFNTYYLGFPHFSSISAINRLQYNAGLMDNDRPESASGFTMKIPGTLAEYKEFYVQWNRQSTLLIRESPLEYFKIHIAGMGKMLLDPGRFEIYSFTHSNVPEVELTALLYKGKWKEVIKELGRNRLAFFLLIILSFVSLLKLFGLLFSLSLWKNYFFWVLAIIISYFLMVTGPVGAFRFAIPLQVFLCILSSYGLFKALNFFKVRSE